MLLIEHKAPRTQRADTRRVAPLGRYVSYLAAQVLAVLLIKKSSDRVTPQA